MSTKGSSSMKNKRPRKGEESPPDPKTRRATKGKRESPIMSTNGISSKNKSSREGEALPEPIIRKRRYYPKRVPESKEFSKEEVEKIKEDFLREAWARTNVTIPDFTFDQFEDLAFEESEKFFEQSIEYAEAAIKFLKAEGLNYDLVKPGLVEGTGFPTGAYFHVNFKAKNSDNPDAPVESFLTQVSFRKANGTLVDLKIDCCIGLGPSEDLPTKSPNLRGCRICRFGIHHPAGPHKGLDLGWE